MNLGDDRPLLLGQARHHPQFPERLAAVEPLGEASADERIERVAAGPFGKRCVSNMEVDAEVWIVDPDRTFDVERNF